VRHRRKLVLRPMDNHVHERTVVYVSDHAVQSLCKFIHPMDSHARERTAVYENDYTEHDGKWVGGTLPYLLYRRGVTNALDIINPTGGISQINAFRLVGIHSTKYDELLSSIPSVAA
jgi:hypothetical protein